MQLSLPVSQLFEQIKDLLSQLSPTHYTQPCVQLGNATIGQHIRHIIELFIELQKGYNTGVINYDARERDYYIETDKLHATQKLNEMEEMLTKENKELTLHANYSISHDDHEIIPTNYYREVMYNLEHTVHHMALIRVGISEISSITLPEHFGVAVSTLKYRNVACAQ
jgi:hypothetical protein